ncbi:MAG: hypothetical protein R2728_06465 [Chitinophagales bacterium]
MVLNIKTNIGGHGVVGLIKGKILIRKTVALRADIDALPIQETNTIDYKSKIDGKCMPVGTMFTLPVY